MFQARAFGKDSAGECCKHFWHLLGERPIGHLQKNEAARQLLLPEQVVEKPYLTHAKGALLLDLLRGAQASRLCGSEILSVRTGDAQKTSQSPHSRDGCVTFSDSKKSNSNRILVSDATAGNGIRSL